MSINNICTSINDLLKVAICNEGFVNSNQLVRSFGVGKTNISFVGLENISLFRNAVENAYIFKKDIASTVSFKMFESGIVNLLRELRSNSKECEKEDFQKVIDSIVAIPIQENEILYELHGIEMKEQLIEFGTFKIYNYPLSIDILEKKYPHLNNGDIFFERRRSNFFLSISVEVRENDKAVELADLQIAKFENILNYMIGDLNHERSVGALNFRPGKNTSRIICSNTSLGFNTNNSFTFPVNIEDDFFKTVQGNGRIWDIVEAKNKTEIEKRLLQSIEWIGKAVFDKDISKALVQFVFAIEGMLQYDDKTFVTPSIVSQLGDSLAYIIEDEYAKRKDVVKYFKELYRKRSAVVHGGEKTIDKKDIELAYQISKLMVISFLTVKPFSEFKTMQQLNEYISELKFK